MSLNSKHPAYSAKLPDWALMEDSYTGERAIKEKGQSYLPATSGQVLDGMTNANQDGHKAYTAYKTRAAYHNFVKEAVKKSIGVMHQKPPVITLPKQMEGLMDKATVAGESLEQLLRRINEAQLVTGRFGLLLDFPQGETSVDQELLPYIATYDASCIINWDEGNRTDDKVNALNMVVLDESAYVRKDQFTWEQKTAFRVLVLGEVEENEAISSEVYRYAVFKDNLVFTESSLELPVVRGAPSNQIPFVFVNSKDITSAPDEPPLVDLANLGLTVYRGEADYRQALFMQGQDTLVVIGGIIQETEGEPQRIGAGSSLNVPQGGDAKFIGADSRGLPEMRLALENDKNKASSMGADILNTSASGNRESGDALTIRVAAETATLNQIVLAGAAALQKLLRIGAVWFGANPEEVIVTPNMDFIADQLGGEELVKLVTAKMMGAPMSLETLHALMQKKGLTEKDFQEELDLIADEIKLMGTDEGGDDPNEDEDEDKDEDDPNKKENE